jgi:hypothetical protein
MQNKRKPLKACEGKLKTKGGEDSDLLAPQNCQNNTNKAEPFTFSIPVEGKNIAQGN